jgi:membrane protein required for colicin V production
VFILTLIVVSLITFRISDSVLDSRVGALDRSFGFIFGLVRGFLLVAIVFILFNALARDQPDWVRNARSYPILQSTQVAIESLLPMNPEQLLPGSEDGQQEGQPGAQPGAQPEGQPGGQLEGQPEAPAEAQPDQPS